MTVYWIWLAMRSGLGPAGIRSLLEYFGDPKRVYEASEEELIRLGFSQSRCGTLGEKNLESARALQERCRALGIRILTWRDPDYPAPLSLTENAPPVLFCRGVLPPSGLRPWIGVVGAREADERGLATARRLGWQISGCGGVVVTGMAKGVDAEAARAALEQGGTVVGVLGTGADVVYPKENQALFERVLSRGCLLSEYPPGTAPHARHFPARNRIISALSDGVVVVQASEHSGALITARWAAEQGRDVFSVPGPAGEALSRGCNQLLREGAILAECGWDVMREYCYRYPGVVRDYQALPPDLKARPEAAVPGQRRRSPAGTGAPGKNAAVSAPKRRPAPLSEQLSEPQQAVVKALEDGPLQLDALIDRSGLPAARVLPELTMLQIKGIVEQKPGKIYGLL